MSTPRWFAHANVNTADLPTAERFYAEVIGLTVSGRTAPALAQDGAGFGLAGHDVRWVGVFLTDRRAGRGPLVDLLEWKEPPTSGRPATEFHHLGHSALRFGLPDMDGGLGRLAAAGGRHERWVRHDPSGASEIVVTSDPDGTRVELVPTADGPIYAGVRVNCSDLSQAAAFYGAAVGLSGDPEVAVTVTDGNGAPVGRFRSRRMYLPAQPQGFALELTQWEEPSPVGRPASPGTHAGIYRVALTVDDIEESHARVRELVPAAPPPIDVEIGGGFPVVRACFFPDPDGAIVEFIQRIERDPPG